MTRAWRTAFALVTCAAAACAPILGLDDLHARGAPEQTDSGGETGASDAADAVGPTCSKHAECIEAALGSPARCVKNKCVNVNTTELCNQAVLPDRATFEREDSILVAAFMRGAAPQLSGAGLAYNLALGELEAAGGILGRPQYHLAVLICDADPAKAERGVKHVIDDLQVPAIIASFGSGKLAELVAGDIVNAGVFTMNPSFTTDFLKFSQTRRLVWSLLGTAEDVALAYRPVLVKLEEEKQLDPKTTKVAIVATNGSLDAPMADILQKGQPSNTADGGIDKSRALDIDEKAPIDADPALFQRFRIDSLEFPKPPDFDKTLADTKQALIGFAPDVIIALTGPELDSFLVEVDAALYSKNNPDAGADASTDAGALEKGPYWILGPSNGELVRAGGQISELGKYIDPDAVGVDERRARIIGVQYAGALETEQQLLFRDRMKVKYKEAATEGLASENFYDAIYWLAYGIAAAGADAPVNGESFSTGVRKLFKGSPAVKAGDVMTIQKAFTEINLYPKDGTLFVGALGPPDINEPTGTWNSVGATFCYPPYQEPGPTPTYDVRRYLTDGGLSGLKPLTCSN